MQYIYTHTYAHIHIMWMKLIQILTYCTLTDSNLTTKHPICYVRISIHIKKNTDTDICLLEDLKQSDHLHRARTELACTL